MVLCKFQNEAENKKCILRAIFDNVYISRIDLTDKTGLSAATITKFTAELINDGIVEEYGEMESTGGRKPILLRINPDYAYIISIDLGGFSTKYGVVRINGEILERQIILTETRKFPAIGLDENAICEVISKLLEKYGRSKFLGIGISISGMVDHMKGRVIFSPNVSGWNNTEIKAILEEKIGLPVFLDTSARCLALAEQWFGAGKNVSNQIFVSVGYSIGNGIIIDSNIYRGSGGFSGEIGHIQVNSNSKLICTCGNYGCLELYGTVPMIIGDIAARVSHHSGYSPIKDIIKAPSEIDEKIIIKALEMGDKIVYDAISVAGGYIGTALVNMAYILNPGLIILGGGIIDAIPSIFDVVENAVNKRSLVTITKICKTQLPGLDAALKGCAILIISQFFEDSLSVDIKRG